MSEQAQRKPEVEFDDVSIEPIENVDACEPELFDNVNYEPIEEEPAADPKPVLTADIKEMLDEIDLLESKEVMIQRLKQSSGSLKKPSVKARSTQPFKKKDISEINKMLGEVSFIEGEESLRDGNLTRAIEHYRDAVKYTPDKVEYLLKLAETLIKTENLGSLAEAESILLTAIDIVPNNMEPAMMLATIREQKGKLKQKTGKFRKVETGKHKKFETSAYNIVPSNLSANGNEADMQSASQTGLESGVNLRTTPKLQRKYTNEYSTLDQRPLLVPKVMRAVLSVMLLSIAILLGQGRATRPALESVAPAEHSAIAAQDLQFQWNCDIPDIQFVVEVYNKGELVMFQMTKERAYRPDLNQQALFKANEIYSWRVRAGNNIGKKYSYRTESVEFSITREVTRSIDPAVEPEVNPQSSPVKSGTIDPTSPEPRIRTIPRTRND
jgi:hypothetical protein